MSKVKKFYNQSECDEPSIIDFVFALILEYPGIDTPEICRRVYQKDRLEDYGESIEDDSRALANFLSEWRPDEWANTCKCVDLLIERGQVIFGDDGDLTATGY